MEIRFYFPVQVFEGHQALLDNQLCDIVVVSTPNMTHFEILMDIINHPIPYHVLVEKPLCTSVEDCKKVISVSLALCLSLTETQFVIRLPGVRSLLGLSWGKSCVWGTHHGFLVVTIEPYFFG